MTALSDLTAAQMAAGYAEGEFSPLEVLASVQSRMDACEPVINALHHRDDERSREAAE
ncbi:amidase, partial [Burkholderia multivorans]